MTEDTTTHKEVETMKTVYQVQFRSNHDEEWRAFNMPGSMYDVTESIEEARATLEEARQYHSTIFDEQFEYRIARITYRVAYL